MKLCLDALLFYERQSTEYIQEAVQACGPHIVLTHYGAWNFEESANGDVVQQPAPSFGGLINYDTFVGQLRQVGYDGYLVSEYAPPALKNHRIAGIEEVDRGTRWPCDTSRRCSIRRRQRPTSPAPAVDAEHALPLLMSTDTAMKARLMIMMFLQFFIWGAWYATGGNYMKSQGMTDVIYLVVMASPIGSIVAPFFMGLIADRLFPVQRVLGVMHVLSGLFVFSAPLVAEARSPPLRSSSRSCCCTCCATCRRSAWRWLRRFTCCGTRSVSSRSCASAGRLAGSPLEFS